MTDNDATLTQFGLAAIIPGFQRAVDILQETLDSLRLELAAMQGRELMPQAKPRRPLPPHSLVEETPIEPRKPGRASGWPDDPAERSREMKRRLRKATQNRKDRAAGKTPRVAKRPVSHQARFWATLTPRQRKERVARMLAAKKPKALPAAVVAVA